MVILPPSLKKTWRRHSIYPTKNFFRAEGVAVRTRLVLKDIAATRTKAVLVTTPASKRSRRSLTLHLSLMRPSRRNWENLLSMARVVVMILHAHAILIATQTEAQALFTPASMMWITCLSKWTMTKEINVELIAPPTVNAWVLQARRTMPAENVACTLVPRCIEGVILLRLLSRLPHQLLGKFYIITTVMLSQFWY